MKLYRMKWMQEKIIQQTEKKKKTRNLPGQTATKQPDATETAKGKKGKKGATEGVKTEEIFELEKQMEEL